MGMGYRMQTSVTWKIYKAQIKAFIQASVIYSGSDFRRKKLKTQRQSKMCFFFH